MPAAKYIVELTADERKQLLAAARRRGKASARSSRQCPKRRIADEATLKREIKAVEDERNEAKATIDWRFTAVDARVKLHRLYPSTSM